LGDWFGKKRNKGNMPWPGGAHNRSSDAANVTRRATIFVLVAVFAAWLMSGVFVLKENERAAVLRLGKFHRVAGSGLHWTLPYPFETHETLLLAESGSILIGDVPPLHHDGLRDAELLTADGYVVEVRLLAQYRVRDFGQYFSTQAQDMEQMLKQAGASALREVVGRMELSEIVGGKPEQIAGRVRSQLQTVLDSVQSGIEITNLSAGADAVQVPQALKAVYAEVEKAQQDKTQAAEQAAAYASQALSAAEREVATMRMEAESYKAATIAEAQAESERFLAVLPEYQKAPQATRDRLYQATLEQVFSNVSKVVVDNRDGRPIYLPLEKAAQAASVPASAASQAGSQVAEAASAASGTASAPSSSNPVSGVRSRDPVQLRQRQ
jgi:membrane protease subunit HflK